MFDIISVERTKEMNKGRLRGAIAARTRYLGRSTNMALDSSRLQRPAPVSSRVCRKIRSGHGLKGVCVIEERLYLASNEEQSGRFADSQTRKVGEKFTSVFNFSEKIYKNVSEGDKKKVDLLLQFRANHLKLFTPFGTVWQKKLWKVQPPCAVKCR